MILHQNSHARVVLDLTREWDRVTGDSIPFAQTMLVVDGDFAARQSVLVGKFLEEIRRNIDWINAHHDLAAGLIRKYKIIPDSAVAAASISRCNLRFADAGEMRKEVQGFYAILFRLNKDALGGSIPDEKFFFEK